MAYAMTPATSFYSAGGNAQYRGYIEATMKEASATTCSITITIAAGMRGGYGYAVSLVAQYSTDGGSTWSNLLTSSGTLSSHPGDSWAWFATKSKTWTVSKNAATYKYRVWASCSGAPYSGGRGPVQSGNDALSVTVPSTSTRYVYYSANYSGAASISPSGPTAVGTAITLRSAPSRSGYTFQNWNTKANGTGTKYAAGASYTGSATVTLYAIWKAKAGKPSLSGIEAFRCAVAGDWTRDGEGTHLCLRADVDSWGEGGTEGSVTVQTKRSDDSGSYGSAVAVTPSGGTIEYAPETEFSTQYDYDALLTITNAQGVSRSYELLRALPKDGFIVRFGADGSVALGNDTAWADIWRSGSDFIRWRCRMNTVFVEAKVSSYTNAVTSSEWTSTAKIPAAYRPTENVCMPASTASSTAAWMWVSTDGTVHTKGTASANNFYSTISYPI